MKSIGKILLSIAIIAFSFNAYSEEHNAQDTVTNEGAEHHDSHETAEFNPGTFILDHIGDSHDWHILTYDGHHVSIPLPVIVYSEHTGLHFFMSYNFEHGHAEYEGLTLELEGDNKGKITEKTENGEVYLPIDISISKNVLSLLMSLSLMMWVFISVARKYKANPRTAPSGMQNVVEPFILFIRDDVAKAAIGEKKYGKFMPYLLTIFFFIWINNMLGIIPLFPGGANLTGNIAVTLVLAVFTFVLTTINGNKNYWKHIINAPGVPWWLKFPIPLMPVVEIMGVFTKPFVLMVRLFANITAGHIIIMGFMSLIFIFGNMSVAAGYGFSVVSVLFVIFMTVLELLVAFIQAYVFTLLSALYIGMAMEEHH